MPARTLAKHLASLNLFREPDGSVHITTASAPGAIGEYYDMQQQGITVPEAPINYVEQLIVAAAQQIVARMTGQIIDRDAVAAAMGVPRSYIFKEDMH